MKKLIFTVTNDLSFDQRMHRICSSLSLAGYDVLLVGRKLKTSSSPVLNPGFRTQRFRCLFNNGKLFYAEYNTRLFFFLLFTCYDAACAIDADTILPVLFASLLKRKKRYFDAHEYFEEVPELEGRNFTKKCWELICRFAVPQMNVCYTVNESLAEIFTKKYRIHFHVIRNVPYRDEIFKNNSSSSEKYILYQGAVNKGRGLEELLEALKSINIKLKIAGSGDLDIKIRKLVEEYGLQEKVSLYGMLNPIELKSLTVSAWLGYNLLDPNSLSYYYSLSNKFFDYIHAGIPSLSNDFPEYKKINDNFEVSLLGETNSTDIIKMVNYLLENENQYLKLKNNCIAAGKKYNWQNEENKLLELYHAI